MGHVVLSPREYQKELLEASKNKNTIVCLGTGTGKTVIAVMLIQELLEELKLPYSQGGKRTVFLVPLVALVHQHARMIERYTNLKVGRYCGELGAGSWTQENWDREVQIFHVLVITAEVFRIALQNNFISFSKINLIIIDECHRAVGHHPYRDIMNVLAEMPENARPRILGLSAALINGKCLPGALDFEINRLEGTMLCEVRTSNDLETVSQYGTKPHEVIMAFQRNNVFYHSPHGDIIPFLNNIQECLLNIRSEVFASTLHVREKQLARYVAQIREVFVLLGPWCAWECAKILRETMNSLFVYSKGPSCIVHQLLELTKTAIEFVSFTCERLLDEESCKEQRVLKFAAPQLLKLLSLIKASKPVLQRGIVFVEKRYIATMVYVWLKEVKQACPELDFAKPCVLMGHGLGPNSGLVIKMGVRKQERILENFRTGYFNVLIATSVVEEGLDVPNCNLVIRFDLPTTFRSYIQSKGRARAADAKYIMLVENTKLDRFMENFKIYQEMEALLYKRCQNPRPSREHTMHLQHSNTSDDRRLEKTNDNSGDDAEDDILDTDLLHQDDENALEECKMLVQTEENFTEVDGLAKIANTTVNEYMWQDLNNSEKNIMDMDLAHCDQMFGEQGNLAGTDRLAETADATKDELLQDSDKDLVDEPDAGLLHRDGHHLKEECQTWEQAKERNFEIDRLGRVVNTGHKSEFMWPDSDSDDECKFF